MPTTQESGFVAGTLVHTDNGLVAINKLKVGDKVLSRDENNPDGELVYKKVLSAFKSAQKQIIIYVSYDVLEKGCSGYLFCTENHPFWVDKMTEYDKYPDFETEPVGWTPAIDLEATNLHMLRTLDEITIIGTYEDPNKLVAKLDCCPEWAMLHNPSDPIAVVDFGLEGPQLLGGDIGYDFGLSQLLSTEKVKHLYKDTCPTVELFLNDDTRNYGEEAYQDYVYNIEVEDNHTYFVGHTGIWVKGQTT